MRLSEEERAYFKACSDELLEHHLVQDMNSMALPIDWIIVCR